MEGQFVSCFESNMIVQDITFVAKPEAVSARKQLDPKKLAHEEPLVPLCPSTANCELIVVISLMFFSGAGIDI